MYGKDLTKWRGYFENRNLKKIFHNMKFCNKVDTLYNLLFFLNYIPKLVWFFAFIICNVFFRVAFQRFNTRMDEFFEETIAIELKKEVPGCMKVNFLPAIKRNLKDSPYLRSAGKLQIVWIIITDWVLYVLRQ